MFSHLLPACRQIAKSPGFSAVVILTLAVGIGANTAIFSVAHALLLRAPDYPESDRIMALTETRLPQFPTYPVSGANFLDWRASLKSFQALGGARTIQLNCSDGDRPRRLTVQRATRGFFDVFATPPLRGRLFTPTEEDTGRRVALLSYALWQSLCGGRDSALGESLTLDGSTFEIIGVMPAGFHAGSGVQLWVPMSFTAAERSDAHRGAHFLEVYGRLQTGVAPEEARAELTALQHTLQEQHPDSNKSCGAHLLPLAEHYSRDVARVLHLLLATAGCVLLVACLNVANLLLARGAARRQELAVRTALGASRPRLIAQLLVESTVLSVAGGLLGVALAGGSLELLVRLIPTTLQQAHLISLNPAVLLFSVIASLVTGLGFGLLPAWRATRIDLVEATKDGARGNSSAGRTRLQAGLVAFEVAASVVLLVGAVLLGRSFARLHEVDPGFVPESALMVSLSLPAHKYGQPGQQLAFTEALLERLSTLPEVTAAGATQAMPLVRDWVLRLIVDGRPPVAPGDLPNTNYYAVTPDYFRAMGIPLVRGRLFTSHDDARAPRVALINETFARKFFSGEDPLGRRIRITNGADDWREVVGIVRDVRSQGADREVLPQAYDPLAQQPYGQLAFVIRYQGRGDGLPSAIRRELALIDSNQPIAQFRLLDEIVAESLARPRFALSLVGGFSLIALLIAAVGLYAVMSYRVAQQTRNLGIRLALGATPHRVLGDVLRDGARIVGLGLLAGTVASLALARLLQSLLHETSAHDPLAFAAVAAVLAGVGLLACWLPARRAARVDPLVALRND